MRLHKQGIGAGSETHNVAIARPDALACEWVIKQGEQAQAAIENLRREGGRGFDDRSFLAGQQQVGFEDGGKLVFAGLAREHDGEDAPMPAFDRGKDGFRDFTLVRVQGLAENVPGKASDGRGRFHAAPSRGKRQQLRGLLAVAWLNYNIWMREKQGECCSGRWRFGA